MNSAKKYIPLAARLLMSISFLGAGYSKFQFPEMMGGYMQSVGLPSILLYPAALLEIGGALALILGWQVRSAALALAGFTFLATVFFHNNMADQTNQVMALKNLFMIGGLLYVYAFGAGPYALDARRNRTN